MHPYPHHYRTHAVGGPEQPITVSGEGLPDLETGPPPAFDGPPGYWSPESMLSAAVANCFILTFRALSRHAGLAWSALSVDVDGTLEKTADGLRFTRFDIRATLTAAGADAATAAELMQKAEKHCLISRSLNAQVHLEAAVVA